MFGSGPWYRQGMGIPGSTIVLQVERNCPFDIAPFNENTVLDVFNRCAAAIRRYWQHGQDGFTPEFQICRPTRRRA